MNKVNIQDKKLIDRKTYKAIKKYDRQQMENYLKELYMEAVKDTLDNVKIDKVVESFREILRDKFGIGPKRFDKSNIEQDIKRLFSEEYEQKERKK
jgi:hypothetical protein